jgi:anti-sigma regulatory factor (Ser/Thr protein kinase)
MAAVGRNPARIIPVWQEFVAAHAGRPVRGVGEPIWPGRSASELVECQLHEALLNLAFADAPSWSLVCPYDTARLDPDVVEAARRAHPHVHERGASRPSDRYAEAANPFSGPLAPPSGEVAELAFGPDSLGAVRALVGERAERAGVGQGRVEDLILAVSELAANSVRHGGGGGVLRVWLADGHLVCEVADRGRLEHPLAGRVRPSLEQTTGRGLWMVNQLCDLVQIRAVPDGTVVRAWLALAG